MTVADTDRLQTGAGTVNADNPWPGLLPFREADQDLFEGRKAETEALLRMVLRERLTVLFGASGFGKSSLLQAGLFPRLRARAVLPVYIRLDFSAEGTDLVGQVLQAIARASAEAEVEAPSIPDESTLWTFFHCRDADFWNRRNRPVMPLLVFDQLEEIFTLGQRDRTRKAAVDRLLIQLADLAEGRPPTDLQAKLDQQPELARQYEFGRHHYKVLLSLREDFLPALEELRDRIPSVGLNRLRLHRMDGEAALSVATQARHLITPQVAERVVRFVATGEPDTSLANLEVEPALLSVVCRELNNKRRERKEQWITADLLEGSQEEILTGFYEESFDTLPREVRTFVEENLLTVLGHRDSVALENAISTAGVTREAIDRLVDRRLLRIEDSGGVRRIELTHDLLTQVVGVSRDHRREALESDRRRAQMRKLIGIAAVGLFVTAGSVTWAVCQSRELKRAAEAYRDAKYMEVRATHALLDGTNRGYRKALLYTLAALDEDTGQDNDALPISLGRLLSQTLISEAFQEVWTSPDSPGPVTSLAVDNDGRWLASTSRDETIVRLWDLTSGEQIFAFRGHWSVVNDVAFSYDGKRLASGSLDGTVRLWDRESGLQLLALTGHDDAVLSVDFRPGGQLLASAGADNTARVWDLSSGDSAVALLAHGNWVTAVVFSPDGRLLASASRDSTVRLWDTDTWEELAVLNLVDSPANGIDFSPDGRRMALGGADGALRIWNIEETKLSELGERGAAINSIAFDPGGEFVAAALDDATVILRGLTTGELLDTLDHHTAAVETILFTPDGRRLVSGGHDEKILIWDTETGAPLAASARGPRKVVTSVAVAEAVIAAAAGSRVLVWDRGVGPDPGVLVHPDVVQAVAISPDGRTLASATRDGSVRLWDLSTMEDTVLLGASRDEALSVALSHDGAWVVSGSKKGMIRMWQIGSGAGPRILTAFTDTAEVASLAFGPGDVLASGSRDGTVRLWNGETGESIGVVWQAEPGQRVNAVAFDPLGRTLLAAYSDRIVRIALDDPDLTTIVEQTAAVLTIAIDSSGTLLATGSSDNSVTIWDLATDGSLVALDVLHGHTKPVSTLAFGAGQGGARRLISGSSDSTVRIWDLATEDTSGHSFGVSALALGPSGQLGSAGYAGEVRLRRVDKGSDDVFVVDRGFAEALTFDSDGNVYWGGLSSNTVSRLNVDAHSPEVPIESALPATMGVTSLAFDSTKNRLAIGYEYENEYGQSLGRLEFWSIDGSAQVQNREQVEPIKPIESVVFTPTGQFLVSGSQDGVLLWNPESGEELHRATAASEVKTVGVSPQGTHIAAGAADGRIVVWELEEETLQYVQTIPAHAGAITSLAYRPLHESAPEGQLRAQLASASSDGSIRLWHVDRERQLAVLSSHGAWVTSLAFSPDGGRLVSGHQLDPTGGHGDELQMWNVRWLDDYMGEGRDSACFQALFEAARTGFPFTWDGFVLRRRRVSYLQPLVEGAFEASGERWRTPRPAGITALEWISEADASLECSDSV